MKILTLLITLFSLSSFGQSFRISQFPRTTNVTDQALFVISVTNTIPPTNYTYAASYATIKTGITNGLVTTNMLYAATNTLFEYTTNAIAASGSGDGTVSNLNTLTADLPLIGNGAGQIKSISVASNYSILNLTNFVELEQVKWRATRQRKPWIGFDTFYSSWNGSNTAAGMALGGATNNIYCDPSDEFCSVMMTNMIESGLHARGLTLLSINDGWQCAKGGRVGGVITVNSNKFPNGMAAFVDKAHRLGYKVRLYNDITPAGSCCGLEPFTNIVVDAQTLKDWKIDALTIDTCGAGGVGGSDDAKRDLHLNFIAALKSVGWNGSYEVHFNVGQTTEQYTNYYAQWPLMQNTFQHTREWGDLYGGVTNWWGEALDHIDLIQHVMGGLRPGHHPQMGYLDAQSQDGFIQGAQWSTIYHFGWMNYFMQAMHQSDLIFSLDYTAHPFVNNRRFQTNDYLYRIQQDNYYDPPTKIAINGDCEIWSKHLDDGSVAFSIINRAVSVSSLGNHFATTPQSIDLNLRGFGVRSNEVSYMVDCINFTNRLVTDLTTFTCATNTFQQWIWYPERNFTIPRGNLIIGGTNQTGPGMVKLMDASASGGATILRSDSTGVSFYDGNNVSRVGATGRNLVATEQVLISDGSVRITNSGIAVLNVGHAGIDNTNHLSIDTVAGNNSLVVSTNGKTYGTFVGDGSGLTGGAFPLTADANFGGFSGTNINSLHVTNRVGIGTTAPATALHVVGNTKLQPASGAAIETSVASGAAATFYSIQTATAGSGPFVIDFADNNFSGVTNPVFGFGYNQTVGGNLALAGENGLRWTIEGNYNDGSGDNKMESYLQYIGTNGTTMVRPWFVSINRDTDKVEFIGNTANDHRWHNDDGVGTAFMQLQANVRPNLTLAPKAGTTVNGDSIFQINAPTTTGELYGVNINGSTTSGLWNYVQQNGNGHSGFYILNIGTGDAVTKYTLNGGQAWTTGLDNSDGDKFKISGSADLGTSDFLTINPTGAVAIIGGGTGAPGLTVGTSVLTVTNSRVGIGNTVPAEKLHVTGTVRASGLVTIENGGIDAAYGSQLNLNPIGFPTTYGSTIKTSGGSASADNLFTFAVTTGASSGTVQTNVLTLAGNGRVGIGVNTPAAKLDVTGDIRATTTITATNGFVGTNATLWGGGTGTPGLTVGGTALVVTNGMVGIGTNAPGKVLDVVGTGRISTLANVGSQVAGTGLIVGNQTAGLSSFGSDLGLDIYATAAGLVAGFNYINQSTSASAGLSQQFILHNSSGTGKRAGVLQIVKGDAWSSTPTEDAKFTLRLLHDGTDTERLTVLSSGNVGIDTTSPQAKLDVAGDIRASTTITATNGFASYATNRVAISATGYTNTLTVSSLPVNVDVYFSGATAALYDQNGTLIHTYVVAVTGDTYAKMKPNWRLVGTTMVGDAVAQ